MTKEYLKSWFKIYQQEFNLFEIKALCKKHNITLAATDTNHSSVIVIYQRKKWYLSTFENTCKPV